MDLTLQLFAAGAWHDALQLRFPDPARGFHGGCHYGYFNEYLWRHMEQIGSPFSPSVSAHVPLSFDGIRAKVAPAFLHDIAPAGAARQDIIDRETGFIEYAYEMCAAMGGVTGGRLKNLQAYLQKGGLV